MRETGFYREMQVGGDERPSMIPDLATVDPADKAKVVAYLEAGNALVTAPGQARDGVDPERGPAGPLGVLTDGVWLWPAELAYYVRTYDLGVAEEFVDHMRSVGYQVAPMEPAELMSLVNRFDSRDR